MQRVQDSLHERNLAIPSAQIVTRRSVLPPNRRPLGRWEELAVAPARIVVACQVVGLPSLSQQADGIHDCSLAPASGFVRGEVRPSS